MDDEEIYINGKPEPEFDDFKSTEYYNSAINRMMKYFDQLHDHGYIGDRVYEIKKTNLFIYALGLYHHSLKMKRVVLKSPYFSYVGLKQNSFQLNINGGLRKENEEEGTTNENYFR